MIDPLLGALVLFLIAGGGIMVLDTFIIGRLRRQKGSSKDDS